MISNAPLSMAWRTSSLFSSFVIIKTIVSLLIFFTSLTKAEATPSDIEVSNNTISKIVFSRSSVASLYLSTSVISCSFSL